MRRRLCAFRHLCRTCCLLDCGDHRSRVPLQIRKPVFRSDSASFRMKQEFAHNPEAPEELRYGCSCPDTSDPSPLERWSMYFGMTGGRSGKFRRRMDASSPQPGSHNLLRHSGPNTRHNAPDLGFFAIPARALGSLTISHAFHHALVSRRETAELHVWTVPDLSGTDDALYVPEQRGSGRTGT